MTQEFRRTRRRRAHDTIPVTDAMTGEVVGHIGNLSEAGMLLIANRPLVNDALYQFRFRLDADGSQPAWVELGMHLLWSDHASAPGQHWAGFRFIGLSDRQLRQLRTWVNRPGGHYA